MSLSPSVIRERAAMADSTLGVPAPSCPILLPREFMTPEWLLRAQRDAAEFRMEHQQLQRQQRRQQQKQQKENQNPNQSMTMMAGQQPWVTASF